MPGLREVLLRVLLRVLLVLVLLVLVLLVLVLLVLWVLWVLVVGLRGLLRWLRLRVLSARVHGGARRLGCRHRRGRRRSQWDSECQTRCEEELRGGGRGQRARARAVT